MMRRFDDWRALAVNQGCVIKRYAWPAPDSGDRLRSFSCLNDRHYSLTTCPVGSPTCSTPTPIQRGSAHCKISDQKMFISRMVQN